VLSQLGVSENSKTRLSFWAVDNAIASDSILKVAGSKNFFLQKAQEIEPLMEKMAIAQFQNLLTQGKNAAAVEKAKVELTAKLKALNKKGEIISEELAKQNEALTVDGQVANIVQFNEQVISVALALLTNQDGAKEAAQELAAQADQLAQVLPLFALDQKALKSGMDKVGTAMGQQQGMEALAQLGESIGQLVDGTQLEVSYGIIMKNIEFLSKLTLMTNPEYNR
jgi:hypothetical protein